MRPALRDLDVIQDFIATRSPAAAHRLVADMFHRTNRLLETDPASGKAGRNTSTREFVLSGTSDTEPR